MSDARSPEPAATAPAAPREPLLGQADIDALAGFPGVPARVPPTDVVRALAEAGSGPSEPLPMLAITCQRLAGLLAAAFRGSLGDDVEVALDGLEPMRFGELTEGLALPVLLATFRAEGWDGGGLVTVGPDFARAALDVLLGAGRTFADVPASLRPFTAIETSILARVAERVISETARAFSELAPVSLALATLEPDPRLVALVRDGDLVWVATFGFQIGARRAPVGLVIPNAVLEPIRPQLRQGFMGVRRADTLWSGHLATEVGQAEAAAEAVLHETRLPLGRILELGIGETLMFDRRPSDLVEIRCGGRTITRGRIGRVDGRIAIEVTEPLRTGSETGRNA